jgi:hypothetical protein
MRTETAAATGTTYYVTSKGSHRHAQWTCANNRRTIHTASIVIEAGAEHAEWPMCEHCCEATAVAASQAAQAAKAEAAPARCAGGQAIGANLKWAKPRGTCPTCGREVAARKQGGATAPHRAA